MGSIAQTSTRRGFLAGSSAAVGAFGVAQVLSIHPAAATPQTMAKAIRDAVGEAPVTPGKVKLELPPITENGNTVPLTVAVEHPMTTANYVKRIHVFNEKNPQPQIATFHLSPRSGRAAVSTRIRLADTQTVVAIAELSDGSFWSASADVVVTIAACTEDVK